jgi:hypothetical protein
MWFLPSTICPSVLAEAGSILDSNSSCQLLGQFVGWNGKASHSTTWQRGWKQAAYIQRLCGRIYAPSLANRGVEWWIASLRATRVNHSVSPVAAVAAMIVDIFGRTLLASLARLNQGLCFSKMSRGTSHSEPNKSVTNWRSWVTKLRQVCSRRTKWVTAIFATVCSWWPSKLWPTPCARDYRTPNKASGTFFQNQLQRGKALQLVNFVAHRFKPPGQRRPRGTPSPNTTGQRLNPVFVNWLMGWPPIVPIGCDCLATEWSQYKQRMRSYLYGLCWKLADSQPACRVDRVVERRVIVRDDNATPTLAV